MPVERGQPVAEVGCGLWLRGVLNSEYVGAAVVQVEGAEVELRALSISMSRLSFRAMPRAWR
jgi:hypothetical protein